MDLQNYRDQIDLIDQKIVELILQRMEISASIGKYKRQNGLSIYIPEREREKLEQVSQQAGESMETYIRAIYEKIFEVSRSYQENY